ncbi:MAG TPA: hypothetical protein PKJ56_01655 [Promineifilum sp.]|nr:hypothetical protein [Promineifilum sp.]
MNLARTRSRVQVVWAGLLLAGLMAFAVLARAQASQTSISSASSPARLYLPVVYDDAIPVLPPAPYSAAARLEITPRKAINASTFNPGSFVVFNESRNDERLVELRIDLSTAIFPNMVFDPYGDAGDRTAKDVEIDSGGDLVKGHHYESPRGGGYDVLVLNFRDERFKPGRVVTFSVDVDPTSIRGTYAPGPGESGSVGGLELVGATVTARFKDGTTLTGEVWRMDDAGAAGPDHSGGAAVLRPGQPARPQIEALGVDAPAVVSLADQWVRVRGPAGTPVTVLVVEGGLFTEGATGPAPGPFEANNALTTREYRGVVNAFGTADVLVALSRMPLPTGQTGFNIITAVFDDHHGLRGPVAEPIVLRLGH